MCVTDLELLDVVGRDVQADADGDEEEADEEEGGQHGAGREDGLPGGEPLLLERRVVRLLALQGPGARHGDVTVLLLGVVAGRHHGAAGSIPAGWTCWLAAADPLRGVYSHCY